MEIQQQESNSKSVKYSISLEGQEVARAFLFLIKNGLRDQPYALLEDVYVAEQHRGKGLGKQLVNHCINEAKKLGCSKIIGTSRYSREKVHKFYSNLGFKDHGKEFRIDF